MYLVADAIGIAPLNNGKYYNYLLANMRRTRSFSNSCTRHVSLRLGLKARMELYRNSLNMDMVTNEDGLKGECTCPHNVSRRSCKCAISSPAASRA